MMLTVRLILLLVLLLVGRAPLALGQSAVATTDTVHSQLTASHGTVTAGQTLTFAWDITLDDGWHVYWKNPGDSGLQPILTPLTEGVVVGDIRWPVPHIISIPPITNYGYEKRVVLMVDVTVPASLPAGVWNMPVRLEYLYCKDVCMPGRVEVIMPLEVAATSVANPAFDALEAWANAHAPLPLAGVRAGNDGGMTVVQVAGAPAMQAPVFIPAAEGWMADGEPQQPVVREGDVLTLRVPADPHSTNPMPTQVQGLVLDGEGKGYVVDVPLGAVPVQPAVPADAALPVAMALALVAGLLLNLMPCVLPVIALKIFGLVRTPTYRARLMHTLAYTAGVLVCLVGMALVVALLQQGGVQVGWGFQLQNPLFVAALAALMLALTLNFWGVFTLGENLTRLGTARAHEGYGEAFMTGLLAVVVATPCTVPFMGGAMAYALGQPLSGSVPVFVALGIGMALPLLAVAVFPPLARILPKPGVWMETFKHALGWPMLATALWLVWVYGKQTNVTMMAELLLGMGILSFGLWLVGAGYPHRGWLVVLVVMAGAGFQLHPPETDVGAAWQPWSKQAETEARVRGWVLVDFTADWCITCKVTEATVLNRPATQALLAKHKVTLLQGDWTRYDPSITAELAAHGRRGVPLYLLYKQGVEQPTVLPQLVTFGVLEGALGQ